MILERKGNVQKIIAVAVRILFIVVVRAWFLYGNLKTAVESRKPFECADINYFITQLINFSHVSNYVLDIKILHPNSGYVEAGAIPSLVDMGLNPPATMSQLQQTRSEVCISFIANTHLSEGETKIIKEIGGSKVEILSYLLRRGVASCSQQIVRPIDYAPVRSKVERWRRGTSCILDSKVERWRRGTGCSQQMENREMNERVESVGGVKRDEEARAKPGNVGNMNRTGSERRVSSVSISEARPDLVKPFNLRKAFPNSFSSLTTAVMAIR
ncbi:hypothetical protein Ccrd_018014 [Cynara cardunculus var. scolymus]|uniref:Uncharacterized protein n=1 Tax=Cynara cardunculus var. scolymus TaxID=59895 RepID=A0A118K234_CYNCS|nr:hypothetical protein Ccrd_018014 [Cynara cardunculus var. scolymus]